MWGVTPWCGRCHLGPIIARELRKRRPKPHAVWHFDDVYLEIDGAHGLPITRRRREGEVLDVLVQSKRNKHAAKLMSYGAATLTGRQRGQW